MDKSNDLYRFIHILSTISIPNPNLIPSIHINILSSTSQIFHPLVLHQHLHHLHPLSPAGVAVRVKTDGYGEGEHVRQMRALLRAELTQKVGMKNQKILQVEWKELWI
jgi:hypothetical protein